MRGQMVEEEKKREANSQADDEDDVIRLLQNTVRPKYSPMSWTGWHGYDSFDYISEAKTLSATRQSTPYITCIHTYWQLIYSA